MSKEKDDTLSAVSMADDYLRLFNHVREEISHNVMWMMEQLWINWSHLGIDYNTKCDRIRNLVFIERDLHRDVIQETEQKLKALTHEVEQLKNEAKQLGQYLSMNISVPEFTEDLLFMDHKKNLESQIVGYRQQVEQRKITIKRLALWQKDLCDSLGVSEREIQEMPLPSEEELKKLNDHLNCLQTERDNRLACFLNSQKEIKDIMESLSLQPMIKFESLVINSLSVDFRVTDRNMERLAQLLDSMRLRLHETENRVLELRERLSSVWDLLKEDRVYRTNFLKAHPGCTPATEKAIRDEIARCEVIKKEKIQVFVAQYRTQIKQMWDQCMYGEEQYSEFAHYYCDVYTEDNLQLHEMYYNQLEKHYNQNIKIYEMVKSRRQLWEEKSDLEAKASDPNRYHNRGGKLLLEERKRRIIDCKLPKIEAQLEKMAREYQEEHGKEFKVYGKPLLQVMYEEKEARDVEKHNKMSARKQALTPNTPSYRSLAVSPLGKRNRTEAGLASTNERNHRRIRRISGRIAALAAAADQELKDRPRRKLNYNEFNPPRIAVNGSIIKHKRTSKNRRSGSRRSFNASKKAQSSTSLSQEEADVQQPSQVADSTILTSYTNFKEHIDENKSSRSSLAQGKAPTKAYLQPQATLSEYMTPKKTSVPLVFTPKYGKENTPKHEKNIPNGTPNYTPKVTRSAVKNEVFVTPRAPLSAAKMNVPKQQTSVAHKTPSSVPRYGLARQNTFVQASENANKSLTRSKSTHTLRQRNFFF